MTSNSIKGFNPDYDALDGANLKFGIVYASWNEKVVSSLVSGCQEQLRRLGATVLTPVSVPGSFELPLAAKTLLCNESNELDGVICIGCLIKGETMHFEYISEAVSHGIMSVGLEW